MRPNPARPFRMIDALWLVAASAASLGLVRELGYVWVVVDKISQKYFPDGILHSPEDGNVAHVLGLSLAPWSFALLILRLRRPRPGRRRLAAQPGFVASAMSSLVMLLLGVTNAVPGWGWFNSYYLAFWMTDARPIAISLIASWTLMGCCGRWRPESSWIDRAGRALAILWIVAALLAWWGWPVA
jgi:hypothetical protein